jgi:hypothetical protein
MPCTSPSPLTVPADPLYPYPPLEGWGEDVVTALLHITRYHHHQYLHHNAFSFSFTALPPHSLFSTAILAANTHPHCTFASPPLVLSCTAPPHIRPAYPSSCPTRRLSYPAPSLFLLTPHHCVGKTPSLSRGGNSRERRGVTSSE